MSNFRDEDHVRYTWEKNKCSNTLSVERGESLGVPEVGLGRRIYYRALLGVHESGAEGRTDEYKVEHPKWELFSADKARIEVDFAKTYGEEFGFLADTEPHSVLLAKGSDIAVYKGERIT